MYWMAPPHLNNEEDVWVGVGDVKDGRAGERSHAPLIPVVVQHVLDVTRVAVKMEAL